MKIRTFNLSNLSSTSCNHDINCLALNLSLTDALLSSVCKLNISKIIPVNYRPMSIHSHATQYPWWIYMFNENYSLSLKMIFLGKDLFPFNGRIKIKKWDLLDNPEKSLLHNLFSTIGTPHLTPTVGTVNSVTKCCSH